MHHREVWKKHFGEIPKDIEGRTYEIHHKDGNRKNNSIENLLCVSIKEHYDLHNNQGDYGAAMLIAKRMGYPPNHLSELQKNKKRNPEIGRKISQSKIGTIPWNKGVTGYKLNCDKKNKRHSSKISLIDVQKIREDFNNNVIVPGIDKIGLNGANGITITYKILFIKEYSKKYNLTAVAIKKIIDNITWKDGIVDVRNKTK